MFVDVTKYSSSSKENYFKTVLFIRQPSRMLKLKIFIMPWEWGTKISDWFMLFHLSSN